MSLLPLYILLTPSLSFFLPPPAPASLTLSTQKRIYGVMKAGVHGWGVSPSLICNSRSLQPSSQNKNLELYIVDIPHLCTLPGLTKHVLQPQVICYVQLCDTMLMFPNVAPSTGSRWNAHHTY